MKPSFAPALALALSLAPSLALAQAAPEPTSAELLQQAQTHVNEASTLYLAQDYEGALAALQKAEPLAARAKDPSLANIRFNIARCYEQLERWSEALEAYEAYNQLPDEPHRKERAWAATRALKAKVYARLSVSCFPAGARLEIRGITNGPVGCPWQSETVRPGNYEVRVDNPGYVATTREIIVVAGQSQNVQVQLDAEAPAPGAAVAAGVSARVEPESPTPVLPWALVGGGVAAIGAGVAFHAIALGHKSDAEDLPPTTERDDAVSSFETSRAISLAGYGVGAAAVVAGVVLMLVGDDEPAQDDASQVRLQPTSNGFAVVF